MKPAVLYIFSSNFCEICSLCEEMGDEIVLDSEGEGDSKVRIGGLREKEILEVFISILPSGERGHSASDYFDLYVLFALLTTRTIS